MKNREIHLPLPPEYTDNRTDVLCYAMLIIKQVFANVKIAICTILATSIFYFSSACGNCDMCSTIGVKIPVRLVLSLRSLVSH